MALIILLGTGAKGHQVGEFCIVLMEYGNIDKLSKTIVMMLSIRYFILYRQISTRQCKNCPISGINH